MENRSSQNQNNKVNIQSHYVNLCNTLMNYNHKYPTGCNWVQGIHC